MRILIVGCGYVGTRVAERLHRSGHEVIGIRRTPQTPLPFMTTLVGDITSRELPRLPERVDAVVLAAGLRRDTDEHYQNLFIRGYGRLLHHAAREFSLKRLVMISTTGVFAEQDGDWVDEQSPVNRDRSPGRYYLEAEDMIREFGTPGSIIRLSGIYGPERVRLIRAVREGKARLLPPPPDYLNQLHVEDAAGAVAHITTLNAADPLYIASDREPSDRNTVLQWIADQLKCGAIPDEEATDIRPIRRSGNKRCRSDRLANSGYSFLYPTFRQGYAALLRATQPDAE